MRSGNYSLETNILSVFSFMKSAATLRETQVRSIEFSVEKTEKPCYLVPVGKFFADDSALVSAMGKWRDAHQYAYPSRFAVTDTGTAKWLKSAVIDNENRLLFLMQDPSGKYLGHIGFLKLDETRCEIDNVLRGESEVPGIVNSALRELERFASEELGLESLELRVLASNSHAVDFYLRNDYHEINRIGLANTGTAGEINLVESSDNISDHFIVMDKNLRDSKMAQGEILTAGPSISNRELTFVSDATMSGWNYHHSDYLNKFQDEFAEYVGGLPLVSFYLEYDLDEVLQPEWKRLGIGVIGSRGFCAQRLAQRPAQQQAQKLALKQWPAQRPVRLQAGQAAALERRQAIEQPAPVHPLQRSHVGDGADTEEVAGHGQPLLGAAVAG